MKVLCTVSFGSLIKKEFRHQTIFIRISFSRGKISNSNCVEMQKEIKNFNFLIKYRENTFKYLICEFEMNHEGNVKILRNTSKIKICNKNVKILCLLKYWIFQTQFLWRQFLGNLMLVKPYQKFYFNLHEIINEPKSNKWSIKHLHSHSFQAQILFLETRKTSFTFHLQNW